MSTPTYNFQRENSIGTTLLISATAISLAFSSLTQTNFSPKVRFNPCSIWQEYGSQLSTNFPVAEYDSTTLPQKEGSTMNEKQMENLDKLNSISNYRSNWNGYGASTIPNEIISKMKGLVLTLNYQPDIFPTARDSIQFEYEKADGSYLEFELFSDRMQMYSMNANGAEKFSLLDPNVEDINKVVNSFYGCNV